MGHTPTPARSLFTPPHAPGIPNPPINPRLLMPWWSPRVARIRVRAYPEAMRLTVEVEGQPGAANLPGDGEHLVAFMSFALSRGFGATHPLIALADRLAELRVPLGPLSTFYEREPEDAEDRAKLELAWQPAADLRVSLEKLLDALGADPLAQALLHRAHADGLPAQVEALLAMTVAAETAGNRLRLVYDL